jgi:hypothetical protein
LLKFRFKKKRFQNYVAITISSTRGSSSNRISSEPVERDDFQIAVLMCRVECEEMVSVVQRRQENAPRHVVALTSALLEQFKWEIFEHPPYSPDLVPRDYHFFLHHNKFLAGQSLRRDQETKDVVQDWLKCLAAIPFDAGTQKLVTRYDKCLNLHGDYVKK